MWSRLVAVTMGGLILLMALSTLAFPERTQAACVPNRNPQWVHIHNGWSRDSAQTIRGVESEDVEEYDPYAYPGGFSSAWVMLQADNDEWAQIGWARAERPGYPMQRWMFIQWTNSGAADLHTYWLSPKSVGSLTDYRTEYDGTNFRFYSDDSQRLVTNNDVFAPYRAHIMGEIHNAKSQMPGGFGNNQPNDPSRERLYTSRWKPSSSWLAFNGTSFITSGWSGHFGQQIYNWWDIDIWDKACQY